MKKKRSIGIIILGVGTIIYALLCILGSVMGGSLINFLTINFISVCLIIIGVGLLLLKNWARKLYIIILTALMVLGAFLQLFVGAHKINLHILFERLLALAPWEIIPLLILWYLIHHQTKEQFKK